MTITNYPEERKLLSITPDGKKAKVWQGALDFEGFLLEDDEQEEATNDPTMMEAARIRMGGCGGWTYETRNLVALMVRKERRTITDFLRMKEKMYAQRVPILKAEMKQKMIDRFGTTNTTELLKRLYQKMQEDPRIQCTTRRGNVIKTTLAEKKAYSAERFASEMERKKI
jgi:hypothetical protein